MDKNVKIGILVKRINNTFEAEINNALKMYDLTKVQFDVLRYLDCNQDNRVTQRDIEKYFGISNPTVSGILDRLESKHLITRITSNEDARYKYIKQTDKAKLLHTKLRSHMDSKEKQLKANFSKEEEESLLYLLQKILNNISK